MAWCPRTNTWLLALWVVFVQRNFDSSNYHVLSRPSIFMSSVFGKIELLLSICITLKIWINGKFYFLFIKIITSLKCLIYCLESFIHLLWILDINVLWNGGEVKSGQNESCALSFHSVLLNLHLPRLTLLI